MGLSQKKLFCSLFLQAKCFQPIVLLLLGGFIAGSHASNFTQNELLDIQYHPRSSLSVDIEVTFTQAIKQAKVDIDSTNIIISVADLALHAKDLMIIDTSEFMQPIYEIETFIINTMFLIKLKTKDTFGIKINKSLVDNRLIVSITFPSESSKKSLLHPANEIENAEKVSLEFQDIPVRKVLAVIAEVRNLNLVISDTVTGNVSINLKGVAWEQALDVILSMRGLAKKMENNILLIAPFAELLEREKNIANWSAIRQQSEKQKTLSIKINYAKVSDVKTLLMDFVNRKNSNIKVSADTLNNRLLVKGGHTAIKQVKALIKKLDIPAQQIQIESRIVTVREGSDMALGIQWGLTNGGKNGAVSGSINSAVSAASGNLPPVSERFNVSLPAAAPAGKIAWHLAKISDTELLDLELSAMQADNRGEVIATPKLMVSNKHEAYIEQGTEIPFVHASSSGATSVTFKKAVLSLKVTPHITPDSHLILDLVVTQDTKGDVVSTSTGPAVSIDTQEISTQIYLKDGETAVLGGIFQTGISTNEKKVPILGDIPLLGHFFKSSQQVESKKELLIFVTPSVIH